jgi:hypothetical protein
VGAHQCSVLNRTAVACRRRRLLFFPPSLQLLSLPSVSAFVAPYVLTPAPAFTGMHLQIFHRHAPTHPGIVQSNQGHGLPRLSTFFDSLTLLFSRFTLVYIKSSWTFYIDAREGVLFTSLIPTILYLIVPCFANKQKMAKLFRNQIHGYRATRMKTKFA